MEYTAFTNLEIVLYLGEILATPVAILVGCWWVKKELEHIS